MKHIYITIPKGWAFDQREVGKVMQDVFVKQPAEINTADPQKKEGLSENYILIQDIVKDCLRCKKRNARFETLKDGRTKDLAISIYYRSAPETTELFIKYEPNNNGKLPSKNAKAVRGIDEIKISFSNNRYTGQLWFKDAPISEERRAYLAEKAIEQRDNRRHIGPNPLAT